MPSRGARRQSKYSYAREQLRKAVRRRQILEVEELEGSMFRIHFRNEETPWEVNIVMAIVFCKGLRIGHAFAREEVFPFLEDEYVPIPMEELSYEEA